VVQRIYSNLAVIDVTPEGFLLRETAPGVSVDEVSDLTDAPLAVAEDLKPIDAPAL
jgi:acyl CoA:acetate/3-ketoacid CoA transferase beta subunit